MTLVLPIALAAIVIGLISPKMTPRLWAIMAVVIVLSIAMFSHKH